QRGVMPPLGVRIKGKKEPAKNEAKKFNKIQSKKGSYEKFTDKEKKEFEELERKISQAQEIRKRIIELKKELDLGNSEEEEKAIKIEIEQQINRTNQLIEKAALFDEKKVEEVLNAVGEEVYRYYEKQQNDNITRATRQVNDPILGLLAMIGDISRLWSPVREHFHNE
ncbi:7850_t:CDS:2, partial [Paraglomus occultum]